MPSGTREAGASAPSFKAVAALGMAAVWLFLFAVVGAISVAGDDDSDAELAAENTPFVPPPGGGADLGFGDTPGVPGIDPVTGEQPGATPGATPGANPAAPGSTPAGTPGNPTATTVAGTPPTTNPGQGPATTVVPVAGDRTGTTDSAVKIGIHAPKSIGGVPLNLAEDPIKGIDAYIQFINENGGINGRMIVHEIEDDRYETSGGKAAADRLVEANHFLISGTLGVDQVQIVANEARKAGIPYHAAGGPEALFKDIGMYQLAASYDTHVVQLARFIAQDSEYKTLKIGITALDSPLIKPQIGVFKAEASRLGLNVVETVFIQKPTEQSSYSGQIQKLKDKGVQILLPFQDPVSTSRMVTECVTALCGWTYSFSNYAHDGDTALALFNGEWGRQSVRGLSTNCYYTHPNAEKPELCGAMGRAHSQYASVNGEDGWQADGQGAATGYQIVSLIGKALNDAGRDLTRERYVSAIQNIDNYTNLVSGPITFRGSSNYAHGVETMVVYEAKVDNKYTQKTPGFVEF